MKLIVQIKLLASRKGESDLVYHRGAFDIAKQLVAKAKDTKQAIALEDLRYIRSRTTVRKSQRARHSNWAFAQLRQFISYKAKRVGISVVLVDPRKTSQRGA